MEALVGAGHLPPYTAPTPQLNEVERVTIAFLDYYFKHRPDALRRYIARRTAGGRSILVAEP